MADRWEALLDEHVRRSAQLPGDLAWRKTAEADLRARGLPSRRDERWRYTRIGRYLDQDFVVPEGSALDASHSEVARLDEALQPAALVVFDNGTYRADLSRVNDLQAGLQVTPLRDWLASGGKLARDPQESLFELLNSAFVGQGAVIELAAGISLSHPVVVLHLTGPRAAGAALHARLLVRCGTGARMTLGEMHLGDAGGPSLATAVTDVTAEADAVVRHVRLQAQDDAAVRFDYLRLDQASGSRVEGALFAVGAGLGRHEVACRRLASGATVQQHALLLGQRRQQQELYVDLRHSEPDATSFLNCKSLVTDHARVVFNGRVLVEQGADGTDARVSNANLLLSADAEVDTKPELEIYADDVKCSHGASVGQLDEQQIYYLRSRGLSARNARRLLLGAFAGELIATVADEALCRQLDGVVQDALAELREAV